jgi:hypothetical protein
MLQYHQIIHCLQASTNFYEHVPNPDWHPVPQNALLVPQ